MQRYVSNKSFPKIILAMIAAASIFSISLTCLIVWQVVTQHEEEMIKVIASDVHDDIRNELLKNVAIAQSMANDLFLHENLKTENTRTVAEQTLLMKKYLTLMRDRVKCSSAFLASDKSKNYWQATGLIKKLDLENDPHDVWYKNIVNEDLDYILNVDTDEADNLSLGIFVNTRIKDYDGDLLGICGVGVKMKTLQKIIETDELNYKIKINLVDRKGVVQLDTDSEKIEKENIGDLISYQRTDQLILNKVDGKYIISKYMPIFDWYLVIQRDVDNMQSAFSSVIFYMSIGFLIALAMLLIFVKIFLRKNSEEVEKSAKKHGIASHAGLYISMHLIDLKKNLVHELSRDPSVNLFFIHDGDDAEEKLKNSVAEMTAEENLQEMLEFINFETLRERMKNKYAIHQEFLTEKNCWCKAYFMLVDENQTVFAIELIDEAKRREEHLQNLAENDAMTGLKNRGAGERAFTDLISQGVEGMFCLLDADKFKSINDNFGHDVGDKVIKAIADCLKKNFRNSDVVVRLGGDEFVVYAVGITDEERGRMVIDRFFDLIDKIEIPELGERKITISLGAVIFNTDDDANFTEIYKRADGAAYKSKKVVGNFATFF